MPDVPVPESIRATTIEGLRIAIGGVLFNVSNFPEKAQTRLLGQDMGPLNNRLTTAIIENWLPAVVAQVQADALEEAEQAMAAKFGREVSWPGAFLRDRIAEYREKGENDD